jgi:hypothetical protein
LLASVLPRWADQKVIDRIVAETAGNPLALLELPRGMTPAELAGGPGFPGTAGLPGRIEESFRRRLELLPEPTRRLVLLAAAGPAGDAALLWRACALAGIDPGAAGPAEDAGLVQVGAWVRFFHPLVRSAVFGAASAQERRAAHGVLAAATDAAAHPGQRAWHRAQAAPGPDDQVAGELENSAELARARGGVAAAAAFLERAAALTLDPQRRSARALAAAQAWHQAGGHDLAVELLEVAEAGPLGELGRAQAGRLRAQIIFVRTDGRDGTVQLLRAAQRLDPLDRDLARATYVDAMRAADLSDDTLEAGRRLRALPLSQPPDATELLLHGYGLFVTEGFPQRARRPGPGHRRVRVRARQRGREHPGARGGRRRCPLPVGRHRVRRPHCSRRGAGPAGRRAQPAARSAGLPRPVLRRCRRAGRRRDGAG